MSALGWTPKLGLEEGIRLAYADFVTRYRGGARQPEHAQHS
jgi:hypothetical protein